MARVTFYTALLLATCFASSHAVLLDCTQENYDKCLGIYQSTVGQNDLNVICQPLMEAKGCLENVWGSCSDPSQSTIKTKIESVLAEIKTRSENCPSGNVGPVILTHNQGTTESPNNMTCSNETLKYCLMDLHYMSENATEMEMCKMWWKAKECLHHLWNSCEDGEVKSHVEEWYKKLEANMSHCDDHHTTDAPWGEPHNMTCSNETLVHCLMDLHYMSENATEMEMCKMRSKAKECLHHLWNSCEEGEVKSHVEKWYKKLEANMTHCDDVSCTMEHAQECTKYMEHMSLYLSDREKCGYWWKAKECLSKVWHTCEDGQMKKDVESKYKAWESNMYYCKEYETTTPSPEHHDMACTKENLEKCSHDITNMPSYMSAQDMCGVWWKTKSCISSVWYNCEEGQMKKDVEYAYKSWEQKMSYCDAWETTTMKPDHHECTVENAKHCVEALDKLPSYYSEKDRCGYWWKAKECLEAVWYNCYEGPTKKDVENIYYEKKDLMGYCKEYHMETTTPEPHSEPHDMECTRENLEHCVDKIENLPYHMSEMEKCGIWWKVKSCIGSVWHNCEEGQMKKDVEYAYNSWEQKMGYCAAWETTTHKPTHHDIECTVENAKRCVENMDMIPNYYSDKDKCGYWWKAKECLEAVWYNCYDGYAKREVEEIAMPWKNRMDYCHQYMVTTTPEPHSEPHGMACTWENVEHCLYDIDHMSYYMSDNEKCGVWWKTKECLGGVWHNCPEGQMKKDVESKYSYWEQKMYYCKDHMETTTHEPHSEPHGMACTWDSLNHCLREIDHMDYYMSETQKCGVWWRTKECLGGVWHNCPEGQMKKDVESKYTHWEQTMYYCKDHMETTTHEPYSEPHGMACTWDSINHCLREIDHMDHYMNEHEKCGVWWRTKECLGGVWHNCPEGSMKKDVESKYSYWEQKMYFCKDHETTTHEPMHHDTDCTWDSYNKCHAWKAKADMESDIKKICSIYKGMLDCFNAYKPNCMYGELKDATWDYIQGITSGISSSCQGHVGGVDESGKCTWDKFHKCTGPANTMKEDTMGDHWGMCKVWWGIKMCFAEMYDDCPMGNLKNEIESTWHKMENHMHQYYCEEKARCTEKKRHMCEERIHQSHDMKDKCRVTKDAHRCLLSLGQDCNDQFVMNQIYGVSMPWVQKVMDECRMYGYGDGDGDRDGPYGGSASSVPGVKLPILALIAILFVRVFVNRF